MTATHSVLHCGRRAGIAANLSLAVMLSSCSPSPPDPTLAGDLAETDKQHQAPIRGELPCPNSIICDDFEHGLASHWQKIERGGQISISNEQAYSGRSSVRFSGASVNASSQTMINANIALYPELHHQLWGKMMVFLQPRGEQQAGDFTFVEAAGSAKPSSNINLSTAVNYRYRLADSLDKHNTLMANYDTYIDQNSDGKSDVATDCYAHGDAHALPQAEWTCLEWFFDAQANQLHYWQNGEKILHIDQQAEGCLGNDQQQHWNGPEAFTKLRIGIHQYHALAPRTLFVDDIHIGNNRMPCK